MHKIGLVGEGRDKGYWAPNSGKERWNGPIIFLVDFHMVKEELVQIMSRNRIGRPTERGPN
ncbi:hypothetical protein N7495_004808 [Penicillium taxi]|uniref:uncharacterized protein n=1 Tax=Penicillium taxi TaxID=168475 RepID=UPI00254583DC|nr:uncharacterized protein N7495_004808 [Penicillium taxi]KAJ5900064.1 hypothetical protein N7495_004808 [Penicillium taxi]